MRLHLEYALVLSRPEALSLPLSVTAEGRMVPRGGDVKRHLVSCPTLGAQHVDRRFVGPGADEAAVSPCALAECVAPDANQARDGLAELAAKRRGRGRRGLGKPKVDPQQYKRVFAPER